MREEERDADRRLAGRGEPLFGEEERGAEMKPLPRELALELERPRLELRSPDADAEVADPEMEEVVVRELLPGDLPAGGGQGRFLPVNRCGGPGMLTRGREPRGS